MSQVIVNCVSVFIPVFNAENISLKKNLVRLGSGERLFKSSSHIVNKALDNISFEANNGDRIGIIGSNGAGKTTLLRTLAGIYYPTSGSVSVKGDIVPLLTTGLGLAEEASGYENIKTMGIYLGYTGSEMEEKIDDIIKYSELGEHIYLPVYTYSAGMKVRLSFSVAMTLQPDILLLDEAIGAGDASFRRKATQRFEEFAESSSIMFLATHSQNWLRKSCNKALLLQDGKLITFGDVDAVWDEYMGRSNMKASLF